MFVNVDRREHPGGVTTANGWWRDADGRIIGHIKWLIEPWPPGQRMLLACDIEVREGFRRQGVARAMIQAVEALERLPMYSTGAYTPDGFAALAHGARLAPGCEASIRHRPMTFVTDWDRMVPKHGL